MDCDEIAVPQPCASVLKPVFASLDPRKDDHWVRLATASIQQSDNVATDALVQRAGGLFRVTCELNEMLGRPEFHMPATWGRFPVTPAVIADLYCAMLSTTSATVIREMMLGVSQVQRLGVPAGIPVKAGWDLVSDEHGERLVTHLVTLTPGVNVWSSARAADRDVAAQWRATESARGPEAVLPLHPAPSGQTLGFLSGDPRAH